jgi:asparagine N-glycosylation enzyme membrane subunit Stt3
VLVSFDIVAFLFWLAISSLLPGAIIALSILRKDDFLLVEKVLIGFAIGLVALSLIPFTMYLVAGVPFDHTIALASVGLLYLIAIASIVLTKSYEGLSLPDPQPIIASLSKDQRPLIIPGLLILLILVSYIIRVSTYGPIYQELDPYFYTYVAQQILTTGFNHQNDSTSWYPDLVVDHRTIPMEGYMESVWYSLYTGGGAYDNMLLAVIASMYPPIAAALAIFFFYLLVSSVTKREWGLAAAGLVAFVPVFIYKLFAGEQEVQPYAFFALAFFYAMYAISQKRKDLRFAGLAGLAFAALALGSSSQILALISVAIFIVMQSAMLFLRDEDGNELKSILATNAVMFIIGPVMGSMLLKDIFSEGMPTFSIVVPFFAALAFCAILYVMKLKMPTKRETSAMILGAIIIMGLIVYVFTPVGDYTRKMGSSAFGIARYNTPLDRTIAEQGGAPSSFGGEIGFIADTYDSIAATLLTPLTMLLGQSSPALSSSLTNLLGMLLSGLFLVFSFAMNAALALFVALVNLFLGTDVAFAEKANSFLLFWLFAFFLSILYCAWRFVNKEDDALFVLFLAMVMPPLVVGLIKAKYTIYAGVLLAIAIGFTLGIAAQFVSGAYFRKLVHDESLVKGAMSALSVIAFVLVFLQFTSHGFAPSMLAGSFSTLYQNDPAALQQKFQAFCSQSNDSEVCAAAADPKGYASLGTNNQYSYKLCTLSVFSNYSYLSNPNLAPPWEVQAASMRCQRLTDYWVSSMEWIKNSTEPGSRVISWWDYGHWINFFGQRNAVVRNEHASHLMIGEVADAYLDSSPAELKAYMAAHDIKYALFDIELLLAGSQFGGKYGALNYLSCAHHNLTSVSLAPGESQCEADHLWETIMVSQNPCTISQLTGKTGFISYKMYYDIFKKGPDGNPMYDANGRPIVIDTVYQPYYTSECMNPTSVNMQYYCNNHVKAVPAYCLGETILADGRKAYAPYYLNQTYPNGDLKLDKALPQFASQIPTTSHFGPATMVTLLYTKDKMWLENGEVTDGYGDRFGKFYDSALYQAIVFDQLPGFKEVYTDGAVKIFKVE